MCACDSTRKIVPPELLRAVCAAQIFVPSILLSGISPFPFHRPVAACPRSDWRRSGAEMLWIRPPSTCACRCFRGRSFAGARPLSRCTPCWTCTATFREAQARVGGAPPHPSVDYTNQIGHRFIGCSDRLLLLRPSFDRLPNYLGDGDLSAASYARDSLPGLRVESQGQRRIHGVTVA